MTISFAKSGLAVSVLAVVALSGCTTAVSMFPMSGPLRDASTATVLSAKVENRLANSGSFSVTYPDGDLCAGRWTSIAAEMTAFSGANSLFRRYGPQVGLSTSVVANPGISRGEALATCTSGNRLSVEFYTGNGTGNGVGVAVDSANNVFKLIF